ncbi:hypothetical protein BDY17DRAFT_290229 [Neohortaea acidophila]|uniref:DH domain-containing protein n=1 Tax=Neohortaea acidophila TaxID=245834 RepID=A0A6A6Q7W0_9PEZI|nr:uncharacterized protein BDY17DRAFT_290229 [Neohortaea acidophila]KAF2488084.1 hypothetical protein BDY17DRAFT_290229 [Neohortaea acidophila]
MAIVRPAPPALSGELSLYHTTDPLLSNSPVLAFYGPAATIGATSSRIQIHVFTPAGLGSYPRLAVSPNAAHYSAVSSLPREEQGDEVIRGLAFGLKKYFVELSEDVRDIWCVETKASAPAALFTNEHVAILASRMTRVENTEEVIEHLSRAFGEQRLSWVDVDVVLPSGAIKQHQDGRDTDDLKALSERYGRYAELIESLGELSFLPTSALKRAPSKASTIGRTASFLRLQKENLRKEIQELLDTEERYVDRISELETLFKTVTNDAQGHPQQGLVDLFPAAIEDIADLNAAFLRGLRTIVRSTETTALIDIETTDPDVPAPLQPHQAVLPDNQGAVAVANCLCDWFPQFSEGYRKYMRSHENSAQLLRDLMKDLDSPQAADLQDFGEQKLFSLLIEPIQRLPRYNLYIDNIVKQLPFRHPAIKPFLKARDLISDICDYEDLSDLAKTTMERLRARVTDWPSETQPSGRLVTAADFTRLSPPYDLESGNVDQGILLVFTQSLVVLGNAGQHAVSAKSLLNELESGPAATQHLHNRTTTHLRFLRQVQLNSVDCLEVLNGEALEFLSDEQHTSSTGSQDTSCQTLRLHGSYERRAERLLEELCKARIEGRFSEAERDGTKWEVRASDPIADTVNLFSAVFEDSNPDFTSMRTSCAPIRVIVDIDRHTHRPRAGQNGVRTVASVSPLRDGLWRLAIDSLDGKVAPEHVPASTLVRALRKKLTVLTASQFGIEQPALTACLLATHADILLSIDLRFKTEGEEASQTSRQERTNRPMSPKKFLSSFLSSTGSGSQPPMALKKQLPPLPPTSLPRAPTMNPPSLKPPSRGSRPSSKDQPTPTSVLSMRSTDQLDNPLKKLEDTLSAYLLALQARKGNIVGRNLKMRASADELAANELYNTLLEDPSMMVLAAQAPVDVLFVAFEKFLNVAWKEVIGQVMPFASIQEIQAKAETSFPADFDEFFKSTLSSFPPQNQRAFRGIMKLLADLLDGTGNDSDRGILTCAFAELLVTEGNPHDYIALIDRFVDDPDTYFGEPLEDVQKAADSSTSPHKRARSTNSASITSNTSSLRKKFGFGLSRENSKSEPESKMASVWRSLSKSTRGDASPGGHLPKVPLHRSQSTDADVRVAASRPVSYDGALSTFGEDLSFTGSNLNLNLGLGLGLSTIGEHPSFIPTQPPRKKRRSSLSDLKALEVTQQASPAYSPAAARHPPVAQRVNVDKSLPSSPLPSSPSSRGGSGRFGSPSRDSARSRLPTSFLKENSPGPTRGLGIGELRPKSSDSKGNDSLVSSRPKSSDSKANEVVITSRPTSGIPTLTPRGLSPQKATAAVQTSPVRAGLAERPGAGNIVKKPSPSTEKTIRSPVTVTETGSPKKLRMQSPQKLRERLQNEQNAIAATQATLANELSKIGDELASTPNRTGSQAIRSHAHAATPTDLAQRVLRMEMQLSTQIADLTSQLASIQSDFATSLAVSEAKCKRLDDLYRESNAENEALYARFNDELGRVVKAVRGGEALEELKLKLKESQEEATKVKRENVRLKRENLGLRAQLRE